MDSTSLVQALQNPNLYDYPVSSFEVIETHLSWVILTGPFAYKIKKPIHFPFANFSTLERRFFYCQEELRLNQRLASELYLGVISISGPLEHLQFNHPSSIIEYAVKMVQFDQNLVLTRLLQQDGVTDAQLNDIAEQVATFHQNAPQSDPFSPYGSLQSIQLPMLDNFSECAALNSSYSSHILLSELETWSKEKFKTLRDLFLRRKETGFIRECHGDLHLENIVLFNNRILIFDCMEFNSDLRWIDTINEIAFLTMDLQAKQYPEKAFYFLNRYLELTGDFEGMWLLQFYQVYRAMVRAKVALLTPIPNAISLFNDYLQLSRTFIQKQTPKLIIMQGVSGSGKTTLAQNLSPQLNAILLRSDIERKRLFHTEADLYTPEKTQATYQRLKMLAQLLLEAGYSTIVDATFLKQSYREDFKKLAQDFQIPFIILSCQAPTELLKQRVDQRMKKHPGASDADPDILTRQLQQQEPLSTEEQQFVQIIKTDQVMDIIKLEVVSKITILL